MLLSCRYDSNKNSMVHMYYDTTSHRTRLLYSEYQPYIYAKRKASDFHMLAGTSLSGITTETIMDPLVDSDIQITKIRSPNMFALRDIHDQVVRKYPESPREADIKGEVSFLYDTRRHVGTYYTDSGDLVPTLVSGEAGATMKRLLFDKSDTAMPDPKGYAEHLRMTAGLLGLPIPEFRRLAVDIEIDTDGTLPDINVAERAITAIGFDDGSMRKVFVLAPDGGDIGQVPGIEIVPYANERGMIEAALRIIDSYPFVLTYNGDNFDMPYIYNRARSFDIGVDKIMRRIGDSITTMNGVHIDLYRVFSNRSLLIYAFGSRYESFALDDVASAMLGEGKKKHAGFGTMSITELAEYCQHDAAITHRLTTYDDSIVMRLLVLISRVANLPIDTVSRTGVSTWLRGMMYNEHRRHNLLIPSQDELAARSPDLANKAVIKGKKYRGAMVMDPKSGIHFDVSVMDFASLYPSIIKVYNLSYETVRCPHKECRRNAIPGTQHWSCRKRNGIVSTLIGALRDLRVNFFKHLSNDPGIGEDKRRVYKTISQALKVMLNASYGVIGSEFFPLYFLPLADSTTAIGRHILGVVIQRCSDSGMTVLYGDTDSLFVLKPKAGQMGAIIDGVRNDYGIDLEVEKEYRYLILSDLKKNYLGVMASGRVDIKGLSGKKSHTPTFIKELFSKIVKELSGVNDADDFGRAKDRIRGMIRQSMIDMESGDISLQKLAFRMKLQRDIVDYKTGDRPIRGQTNLDGGIEHEFMSGKAKSAKGVPQHVNAAKQMERDNERKGIGKKPKKGDIIAFVKTTDPDGVRPLDLANYQSLDMDKYKEFLESVLTQLTSPMGIELDTLLNKESQTSLGNYL